MEVFAFFLKLLEAPAPAMYAALVREAHHLGSNNLPLIRR
jgi:hypothetical protein